MAGLTAAFRLQEAGWTVQVLEASNRVGGRVQTIRKGGYIIDTGAGTLFEGYADYMALAGQLGLSDQIVLSAGPVATLRDGRIHTLDATRLVRSGVSTRLISWKSKLLMGRLLWDIVRARKVLDYRDLSLAADLDIASVRDYCTRHLNEELHDYLCEPMIRGLVLTSADRITQVELLSGFRNIFSGRFVNLLGGLDRFGLELEKRLDVRLNARVEQVQERDGGVAVRVRNTDGSETQLHADACVVATPLHHAAAMCPDHYETLHGLQSKLGYSTGLVVQIGVSRAPDCEAFVLQIPTPEMPDVALIMLDHRKAPDRAPSGHGLISVLWQQESGQSLSREPDDVIVKQTLARLDSIWPGLAESVDMSNVSRWSEVVPFTAPGSLKAQRTFKQTVNPRCRIQFAGDFLSTGGQNTAVVYGNIAARNLIEA